jgi:hypothetical protein
MIRSGLVLLLAVPLFIACTGDAGPKGDQGDPGMTGSNGSDGPPGPITDPPALASLSPRWGSANTHVTITGTGFSATAADNHVYFDGHAAFVVSATATTLVVRPDVATDSREHVAVNVEVANQVSNALVFELVASGTADRLDVALPTSPTGVVAVGADVYFAAGGLYKLTAGVVTRVVEARTLTLSNGQGGTFQAVDAPLAVAAFGGNVYFTTTFGAVRTYTVATGDVTELLAPALGGDFYPGRTGLVFDAGGDLYVVDRNLASGVGGIIRIRTNQTVQVIVNAAFDGNATLPGIYGIASDGTDLFVTNELFGEIYKVSGLATTPAVSLVATGIGALQGIAVVGTNVIASADDGFLESSSKTASGGVTSVFGDAVDGYLYQAAGLGVSGTDLLLAQPQGGVVRKLPSAATESAIIAAGTRVPFATVKVGTSWYLATSGTYLFDSGVGPSVLQPDGAIVEITSAGASRVVANTLLPMGLVPGAAGELTATDCAEQRLFTLAIATGVQTDRLTSTDGLGCPTGLAIDGQGTLFYLDTPLGSSNPATVGKLVATTHTASFATAFAPGTISIVLAGNDLVASGFGPPGGAGGPIQKVGAAAGGAATLLVPAQASGASALGVGPDGTLFGLRSGLGDIVTIDTATGAVTPWGSALAPGSTLGPGGGSFSFSMAFGADGTIELLDLGQGGLVAVAP